MIRLVSSLIIFLISTAVFAADTVRLDSSIDLVVTAVTDTTYSLNSVKPSGDATADSAPAKIYVPISYSGNSDYFLLKGTSAVYDYTFDLTNAGHVLKFPLYVNVGATDKYLHVAVKDGSSYKYVKAFGTAINSVTNTTYNFELAPYDVCAQMSNPSCADLQTRIDEKSTLLYFFLSTTSSFATGQTIDPASTYTGGIYFQLNMSNRTYSSLTIAITKVRQGDKRAFFEYTGSETILQPKYIKVFDRGGAATTSDTLDTVSGTLFTKEYAYNQSGEVAITDLVNSQTYNLSILFVDNYLFATKLSPTAQAKPQQIEELLKKQGCFLLTAGFGEEHEVINYFRHFRDATLVHYKLGRMFIHFYYENAPKYALEIYQSSSLRFVIRSMAYFAYYFFRYFWLVLFFFIFAYAGKKILKKSQIFKSNLPF